MIKLFLCDLDGTLVTKDILDVICGLSGNEGRSAAINRSFIISQEYDIQQLKQRIDFLKGLNLESIYKKLDESNFLRDGVAELFKYLRDNKIATVLHSGNIIPVLEYYRNLLFIDYIVGTKIIVDNNMITGVNTANVISPTIKADECARIIDLLSVKSHEIVAIGDSFSDVPVFLLAKHRFFIDPKNDIDMKYDYPVIGSMHELIDVIDNI